jgi:hybrid polyketide synthase / nonribosomal peptide synthetase ACE1
MSPAYVNEPIAVIGSGCRFPGESSNPSKLWALLQDPRDVQRKIDRFRADNFHNRDGHYHGASNVLAAYLLEEDPKLFDTQFFNIPLSEAEAIDPQQRLLMETVYESLETAGISMESLSGSNTAVYVGVMCNDFEQIGEFCAEWEYWPC